MGGTFVEVIKDSAIGFVPLNLEGAKNLIGKIRYSKQLEKGFRNLPPAKMQLIEETLVKFSKLLEDFPEIKEIDINPFRVNNKEAIALDGRIVL